MSHLFLALELNFYHEQRGRNLTRANGKAENYTTSMTFTFDRFVAVAGTFDRFVLIMEAFAKHSRKSR